VKLARNLKPLIDKFPVLARTYRYLRDSRLISSEPIDTPMGFKFIGNTLMQQGLFEKEEYPIFCQLLRYADCFINVGANVGYYCCIALKAGKNTIAFEPIELNLQYLYKNVKANHWENKIEIFPIAIGSNVGLTTIYGGGTGASLLKGYSSIPDHYFRTVPISTLDHLLLEKLSGKTPLFLIDVEGMEKFVLEGAIQLIQNEPKPIWIVEIATTEHQPQGIRVNPYLLQTFEFFWRYSYECYTVDKKLRKVTKEDVVRICETEIDDFSVHNFMFIDEKMSSMLNPFKPPQSFGLDNDTP
jgi:FkbM family methyltransferase